MIVALEGILESRGIDSAIVKVGPLSLHVYAPVSTLSQLGSAGDAVSLHTHLYLREDNFTLYGFASAEELELFRNLISVSGIGPKAAVALLSVFFFPEVFDNLANLSAFGVPVYQPWAELIMDTKKV